MADEKAEPTPLLAMAEKIHEHAHRGCTHEPEPISEMEMALAEVMVNLEANPNFEVSMSVAEPAGAETVEVDRDYLDILFWLATKGDVAMSKRKLKHGFRKHQVCSGDQRDADCPTCQAFTAVEKVLGHG